MQGGERNRTAFSVLVLGATIKVDHHRPRVGDSGPQDADTNKSSGIASMRPAGTIQRGAGN